MRDHPIHPSEIAVADMAADMRGLRSNVEMWSKAANDLGRQLGDMRTERDALRASLRELLPHLIRSGVSPGMKKWQECRVCLRSATTADEIRHAANCTYPAALALLGDPDGERVEGKAP